MRLDATEALRIVQENDDDIDIISYISNIVFQEAKAGRYEIVFYKKEEFNVTDQRKVIANKLWSLNRSDLLVTMQVLTAYGYRIDMYDSHFGSSDCIILQWGDHCW